jgi:hypothetical protein
LFKQYSKHLNGQPSVQLVAIEYVDMNQCPWSCSLTFYKVHYSSELCNWTVTIA